MLALFGNHNEEKETDELTDDMVVRKHKQEQT